MLEIKKLTKIYDNGKKAVDELTLSIKSGDIYGFIGSNGSGKTSTIKSIVGIHDFNSGEINISGISIKDDPIEYKKQIAYIPDSPDLYEHLTGMAYINFIADLYEVPTVERKEKIKCYSDLFEMTENLSNVISHYSHGMKQRTALISAMVHSPKILILDEPFVGLDPRAAFLLKQVMNEITSKGGAIFFSTHVLDVAEKLCNKIAIIKEGKLMLSGDTSEIIKNKSLEEIFLEVLDYE